jgi:perosamine synthetase
MIKKKIAILGSSGNLGGYFFHFFNSNLNSQINKFSDVYFVSRKNNNKTEKKNSTNLHYLNYKNFKKIKSLDYIIYLASSSNSKKYTSSNYKYYYIKLKQDLKSLYKKFPKSKFLYFSSGAVYGDKKKTNSNKIYNFSKYYYSLNKKMSEIHLKNFSKQYSYKIIILRGYSFFGPFLLNKHTNSFVVNNFIKQSLTTNIIKIDNPNCKKIYRSFLCYDDLVKNVLEIIKLKFQNYLILNMGSDQKISLYNLAKKIQKITGSKIYIKQSKSKIYESDKISYYPNLRLLKKYINFHQNNLDKSLEKVINLEKFELSHYKKVTKPKNLVLTSGPLITDNEKKYVLDSVTNSWGKYKNKYNDKLTTQIKKKFKIKYAIPCSSATGALHLALEAMGIGKNDEVILPAISWIAIARAVTLVGAKPVFVDVCDKTLNIDPEKIENKISKKTAAIIVVHMYGYSCEIEKILKICKKYKIKLLEDSAPALGSMNKNKYLGTIGDAGVYSFQGAKIVTSGEGGMLITNNKKIYDKALTISNFGIKSNEMKYYWVRYNGLKYKMSNLQQSMIYAQLKSLNYILEKKNIIHNLYKKYLFNNKNIYLIENNKNCRPNHWMNTLIIKNKKFNNKTIIEYLYKNNIDTRPIFPMITEYPMWKYYSFKLNKENLNTSKFIFNKGINLPSGVNLDKKTIIKICNLVNKFIYSNKLYNSI